MDMIQGMDPPTKEANVTREFAWLFCPQEIQVTFTVLNYACNDWATFRYFNILESFASKSPWNWHTTNWESEHISTSVAPILTTAQNLANKASHSTSLFESQKPNLRECSILMPSGDSNTILTPESRAFDAPSTYIFHDQGEIWCTSYAAPLSRVNSVTKSVRTYPLIALLGLYLISKDPKVVPYLAILPVKSNLHNSAYNGCLVKTYTMWAWKY